MRWNNYCCQRIERISVTLHVVIFNLVLLSIGKWNIWRKTQDKQTKLVHFVIYIMIFYNGNIAHGNCNFNQQQMYEENRNSNFESNWNKKWMFVNFCVSSSWIRHSKIQTENITMITEQLHSTKHKMPNVYSIPTRHSQKCNPIPFALRACVSIHKWTV